MRLEDFSSPQTGEKVDFCWSEKMMDEIYGIRLKGDGGFILGGRKNKTWKMMHNVN